MPAVSKSQRRLAGMALAAKEGRGSAPSGMMGMSLEDLKHYAGTPEKGLKTRKTRKQRKNI
jgi:L,D-peptidoglycan transpeptidase YkuD (ErfK/YbiS/YcfS/YnhG family)